MTLTATETLVAPVAATDRRATLAAAARMAATTAFYGAVILSPFRARFYLDERDVPPVFTDYTDILLFWNQIFVVAVDPHRLFVRPPLDQDAPVALLQDAVVQHAGRD